MTYAKRKKGKGQAPRKHWSGEEDEAIVQLVSVSDGVKWGSIAQRMIEDYGLTGRSGKQCRERWQNHLDPSLNKSAWTSEEFKTLFLHHKEYGNNWTQISTHLPGRSLNSIKNHFYSLLRKQFKKWKGNEPTRYQLKKYDSFLCGQILNSVNKKTNICNEEPSEKTLADLDPVETSSEKSQEISDFLDHYLLDS